VRSKPSAEHGDVRGKDRKQIVRDSYRAFREGDRGLIEGILAEEFSFHAPPDPSLDRDGYFERCWPNAGGRIVSFDFVRMIEDGDEVVVTYEAERSDGSRLRNTEVHTFDGDRICRQELYFGWDL
jgi:ketosteroid isomerase-like protein